MKLGDFEKGKANDSQFQIKKILWWIGEDDLCEENNASRIFEEVEDLSCSCGELKRICREVLEWILCYCDDIDGFIKIIDTKCLEAVLFPFSIIT